jgi:hypothetical protein
MKTMTIAKKIAPSMRSVEAEVGHLFLGEYLKQSGKNGGDTCPYVIWNVRF